MVFEGGVVGLKIEDVFGFRVVLVYLILCVWRLIDMFCFWE